MQGWPALVEALTRLDGWRSIREAVEQGRNAQIFGAAGGLAALAVAALAGLGRPVLVVAPDWSEAERLHQSVTTILDGRCRLLPPRPDIHGTVTAESRAWEHRRLSVFATLADEPNAVVVAPVEAARQLQCVRPVPPLVLTWGETRDRDAMLRALASLGYERVPFAEQPGQFAVRGGVVDVVTPDTALRAEFFGDDIDTLATFDPETQRTVEPIPSAAIRAAREFLWTAEEQQAAWERLSRELADAAARFRAAGRDEAARRLQEVWGPRLSQLEGGRPWPGIERVAQAFRPLVPLTAVFPTPPIVVFVDRERVLEAVRGRFLEETEARTHRLERGEWLPVEGTGTLSPDEFGHALDGHARIELSLLPHHRQHGHAVWTLAGRPAPRLHGQRDLLLTEVERFRKSRHRVLVVVGRAEAAEAIRGHLLDARIPARSGYPVPGEVGILVGGFGPGFVLPEAQLAVLTDLEIVGRAGVSAAARPRRAVGGQPLLRLNELKPGDYVVHVTHGIGRYEGLVTLETGGQHREYLKVTYAGDDVLYVPVDQLEWVQRYAGPDDRPPKLSRLGGGEWQRAKERVRASVRQMAEGLLKLYAAREARPGYAFPPDSPWQQEFEAAFPFQETPDQLRAVAEIKRDMERPRPMDRLLLGDVGYGKTEVALRAAFKAIMAGKQVAFLVPTTLLAEQHLATATSRMAGFPVRIEVLSRFRSAAEQRATLKGLADGQVDMVIGTHRLLSADVRFHDLGLLIIDEEHRFGVAHKERIKRLKETVDVLTLTATPIPRTLHMAMVGVRDMSLIETPPEERFPVETIVAEYDDDLIREAIRRELERDGQVFYLQNRIRAMDAVLAKLRRLLPDLRIGVAHGQMDEDALEEVMTRFLHQEYDVLLTTTIIESGLDFPNVNTLIVEDADRLGLAQLYQLRGRVGRSSRLAYAYFTVRKDAAITPEAEQRLAAIREFTELGAGYQLALRDLEIRGAGNLLGPEQHGFVAAVGFELYTQLLAEAVRELKGEAPAAPVETTLDLKVEAFLPEAYIADAGQRIAVYKRLVTADAPEAVDAIRDELQDLYGTPPDPVEALIRLSRVRILARRIGLSQVAERQRLLLLRAARPDLLATEALVALAARYAGRLVPIPRQPELGIRLEPGDDVLAVAEEALMRLAAAEPVPAAQAAGNPSRE